MFLRLISFAIAAQLAIAAVSYTYDDAGRLTKVDYGDGRTITYVYDKAGNLLQRTSTTADGSSKTAKPPTAKQSTAKRAEGDGSGTKK